MDARSVRSGQCRRGRQGRRGFTYLGMLFFVAITAAALAALGQAWATAAQREKERELEWRGAEIGRAMASYAKANPPGQYPRSLDDLLVDRRGVQPRHHLRRAYVDPFTLQTDWVLVPDPSQPGRFSAVHSRSEQPLLKELQQDGGVVRKASGRVFAASAYADGSPPPPQPASAPSAASAPASEPSPG
jgi:type II secretory pathway pseudopilin PulG